MIGSCPIDNIISSTVTSGTLAPPATASKVRYSIHLAYINADDILFYQGLCKSDILMGASCSRTQSTARLKIIHHAHVRCSKTTRMDSTKGAVTPLNRMTELTRQNAQFFLGVLIFFTA